MERSGGRLHSLFRVGRLDQLRFQPVNQPAGVHRLRRCHSASTIRYTLDRIFVQLLYPGFLRHRLMRIVRPVFLGLLLAAGFYFYTTHRSSPVIPDWVGKPNKVELTEAATAPPFDAEE